MRIVVCADSSKQMGFGHITRSLTLARALTDLGAEVICIGQGMDQGRSVAPSFETLDAIELSLAGRSTVASEILELRPAAVIADGYHFGTQFFESLEKADVPYGVIDDNGETQARKPRVIHNQNPSASRDLYSGIPGAPELLLGVEYALLRKEIESLSEKKPAAIDRVLVSFGGTDVLNLTLPVAKELAKANYRVFVSEQFQTDLDNSTFESELPDAYSFFSSSSFLEVLASAEVAVLGAGTSLWEASALGTKTIIGVITAENQAIPSRQARFMGLISDLVDARPPTDNKATAHVVAQRLGLVSGRNSKPGRVKIPSSGASKVAAQFLCHLGEPKANS